MGLVELAGPDELSGVVEGLASRLAADYEGKNPVLIGVLKGAFVFMSDLVRALDIPVEVDFVRASSYGGASASSGRVSITKTPETGLDGRHVVVVEDIVDTGLTLNAIIEHLQGLGPASLSVCTLLDKPSGRKAACRMDYVGMEVAGGFVVGYGLDFAERYRNLKGLYLLEEGGQARPA